MELKST